MREIKFRAWNDETNHMCTNSGHVVIDMKGQCFNLQTGKRLIPLLSTGLHDRCDQEIYEGDVVGIDCTKWTVPAVKPFVVKWEKTGWNISPCGLYYTVIGNIYSNPELMEGE